MATPPGKVLAANSLAVRVRAQAWLEHQLDQIGPSGMMAFDGAELA